MDSNSGSLQSSSGGDEEYDSRSEAITAFLDQKQNANPMAKAPPPPPPSQSNQQQSFRTSPMFDPLSNYFDPLIRSTPPQPLPSPNSFLNLDMVWPKSPRSASDPTHNTLITSTTSFPAASSAAGQTSTAPVDLNPTNVVRSNSKKRSRASRRAPTTVLTTDTTNFRAMVQEFTGIPAPPFAASPFPRSRLDLFGSTSRLRMAHLDHQTSAATVPPFLLKPFPQKLQTPPPAQFMSTNPSFPTSSPPLFANISSPGSNPTTFQLPSDLQPPLLDFPNNPILTFQSLLQSTPKFPSDNPTANVLSPKPNVSSIPSSTQPQFSFSCIPNRNITSDGGRALDHDQDLLRSVTNNYSAASASSDREQQENDSTRSEGMVESWICSSD